MNINAEKLNNKEQFSARGSMIKWSAALWFLILFFPGFCGSMAPVALSIAAI